jgi:hypothetical protein
MADIQPLFQTIVPLGQQQLELQQIEHVEGGMPLLRLRIREGKRFTILDIDPVTAKDLSMAIDRWCNAQGKP